MLTDLLSSAGLLNEITLPWKETVPSSPSFLANRRRFLKIIDILENFKNTSLIRCIPTKKMTPDAAIITRSSRIASSTFEDSVEIN